MSAIKLINRAVVILCLCAAASTAFGQPQSSNPQQSSAESQSARLGLKNRVFELKHRDPESLVVVLRLLNSNSGMMSYSNEYKTITVRDYPENIATIDEAIRRLDTPTPPAPGIELHVHVLIASNAPGTTNQVPAELSDVVRQLQNTLTYKNYYVMTSAVLRTKEGNTGAENKGVADFKMMTESAARNSPIIYAYAARQIKIDGTTPNNYAVQIGKFNYTMRIPIETVTGTINYESVGFETPVNMREGEKVVVGTTTMQEKGLIVVLTARITK